MNYHKMLSRFIAAQGSNDGGLVFGSRPISLLSGILIKERFFFATTGVLEGEHLH